MRAQARLARGPAHCFDGAVVFGIVCHSGEMQVTLRLEDIGKTGDQCFVDAVELIRPSRQNACLQLILKPLPLEGGAFVKGGRCVGIIFQQLGRARAVIGQIETPVDFRIAPAPAFRYEITVRLRNGQPRHQFLAGNDLGHGLTAHAMQLGRGVFDVVFNLLKRQRIGRGFVPIGLAVHIGEGKADLLSMSAPVWPLGQIDFLQRFAPSVSYLLLVGFGRSSQRGIGVGRPEPGPDACNPHYVMYAVNDQNAKTRSL